MVKYGTNLDSNVRYFCQEKDYRSLISGEVGLVPKIVRYWSFVIDQYCVTKYLHTQKQNRAETCVHKVLINNEQF